METIYLAFFERDPLSADNDVDKFSTPRMNEDGFGKKKRFSFIFWVGEDVYKKQLNRASFLDVWQASLCDQYFLRLNLNFLKKSLDQFRKFLSEFSL